MDETRGVRDMMYLVAWLIGAIMGIMCIAVVSAGRDSEVWDEGYNRGYVEGLEHCTGRLKEMIDNEEHTGRPE